MHLSWTSGRWNKCRWIWQWPSATWILGSPSPPQVSSKLFLPSPKFTGRQSLTLWHKRFTPSLSTPSTVTLYVPRFPGKPKEKFDRPIPRNASGGLHFHREWGCQASCTLIFPPLRKTLACRLAALAAMSSTSSLTNKHLTSIFTQPP